MRPLRTKRRLKKNRKGGVRSERFPGLRFGSRVAGAELVVAWATLGGT